MHKYIVFPGHSCLGLEMGRYQLWTSNLAGTFAGSIRAKGL